MLNIISTILSPCKKLYNRFDFALLLCVNRMRTSPIYLRVAPAHRAYRSYLQEMVHDRAFIYALLIVPATTATISLPSIPQASASQDVTQVQQQSPSTLIASSISDTSVTLDEALVFTFAQSPGTAPVSVDFSPQVETILSWNDDRTELSVTPLRLWDAGEQYSVAVTIGEGGGPATFYNFRADGYPRVKKHLPDIDQKNFVVEEGSEINIYFDRPIDDFDFRGVSQDGVTAEQQIITETKEVKLTFTEAIAEGKEIEFILYTKHKSQSSEAFYPVDTIILTARPPQPSEWPTDSEEREILSIDRTIPKITEGKYIDINLEARLTTLFEDGVAIESFVNSPGAADTPTPTGEFKVENKGIKPLSRSFGVYLPYWLAFTPDGLYGIHDLVEWPPDHPDFPDSPGGGKESISSIDAAVSPGCVRHDSENSLSIYEWAAVGTPIIIY